MKTRTVTNLLKILFAIFANFNMLGIDEGLGGHCIVQMFIPLEALKKQGKLSAARPKKKQQRRKML